MCLLHVGVNGPGSKGLRHAAGLWALFTSLLVSGSWGAKLATAAWTDLNWRPAGRRGVGYEQIWGAVGLCRGDSLLLDLQEADRLFRVAWLILLTCPHFSNAEDKLHLSSFTASPSSEKRRQGCRDDFTFLCRLLLDGRFHAVRLPFRSQGMPS